MKQLHAISFALVLLSAAARAEDAPVLSPQINKDHSVVFSLRAPKAQMVALRGQWDRKQMDMTKDAEGLWSVTVPALQPGVWEYSFIMDGLTMIDPSNPAQKPQRVSTASIL